MTGRKGTGAEEERRGSGGSGKWNRKESARTGVAQDGAAHVVQVHLRVEARIQQLDRADLLEQLRVLLTAAHVQFVPYIPAYRVEYTVHTQLKYDKYST